VQGVGRLDRTTLQVHLSAVPRREIKHQHCGSVWNPGRLARRACTVAVGRGLRSAGFGARPLNGSPAQPTPLTRRPGVTGNREADELAAAAQLFVRCRLGPMGLPRVVL
jgi:hypothetical protein